MSVQELERLVVSGRYREAGRLFLQLMLDDSLSQADMGKACYLEAIAKSQLGEAFSAVQLNEMAEQQAVACGDTLLLGKVWSNAAAYYRRVGDYHRAQEIAERWLANQGMYPELAEQVGKVQHNLAFIHKSRGQMEHAWRHIELAIAAYQQEVNRQPEKRRPIFARLLVHALQSYAWWLFQHNRIGEGDVQCAEVEQHLAEDDAEGQREQVLLLALRAYMQKDYRQAMTLCQELMRDTTHTCSEQDFWVHWLVGMSAADLGLVHIAKDMAETCLNLATRLNQPYLMNQGTILSKAVHQLGGANEVG